MTDQIRVLLTDDEPLARAGITQMLQAAPDISVVAQAEDGQMALRLISEHRPDVVLLDMQMPRMNGLEALAEIRRTSPDIAVVILTAFQFDEYLLPAIKLGAAGYLLKDCTLEELHGAVRAARDGNTTLAPAVTRRLLEVMGPQLGNTGEAREQVGALTDRERDVLECLTNGLTNAEIARTLHLAVGTVKTHVTAIMTKLAVTNRTQAAIIGYEAGLTR
ncbi:response regulator transcription factor [Leucobacter coleopterorum]|uniref:Response regulator transcription factor n=1 Tax=Leucobacter coleopterorum TaxID=2714933 RepID=A0ABX6JUU7_9MICO|nr:response regulator transcription factor [Leucobacter coleopterorum]QIM18087.1 response regulator transcription factor [Leucobacter coleopterorum]